MCDDNQSFIAYERRLINQWSKAQSIRCSCESFSSGCSLLSLGNQLSDYDLFILDYDMKGLTGFETANQIRDYYPSATIAFATNFIDLTREGYKYGAIRYLIKQDDVFKSDLIECINYVYKDKLNDSRVVLQLFDGCISVDVNNIIYISSDDHYITYHIKGITKRACLRRYSIDNAFLELPETFVRIHQRYAVNLRYINEIHDHTVEIIIPQHISLPIARNRYDDVFKQFYTWRGSF